MKNVMSGLAVTLVGVCLGSFAFAGVNEPEYFVQWIGYASSKSGPYIDTGYAFTKMPLVEAGLANVTCGDSDFAGTSTAETGCFIIDLTSNGAGYYYRYGSSSANLSAVGSGPYSLNTSTFNDVVWGQRVWYNGTNVAVTWAAKDSTFANNTKTFRLFRGRSTFSGTAKLSYCRLYNGTNRTELVRNLRPGMKDGVIGLYDYVEDKFYSNVGSGSFDYGLRAAETNAVYVDTCTFKFGEPTITYGANRGFAAGEKHTFTAPSGTCEKDGYLASCTGWKLYKFDSSTGTFLTEPYLTGTGTTCEYTHPDPAEFVRLEWQWVTDASSVATQKAGEWDDPTVWTSGAVPTEDSIVTIDHDVHCSSNVVANSITVHSGATLRFHASSAYSVTQATPDAPGESNFTFRVVKNLKLTGGSLALHGGRESPVITNLDLSVGGDVTLSGAAVMTVAAAAYNGACCDLTNLYNTATRLKIGGSLTLGDTAKLYTVCDQKVGSPVRIDCTNFTLGASAKVCADERGWQWLGIALDSRMPFKSDERGRYTFARGPGHDNSRTGGGYGGGGSNNGTATAPGYGATYGYAYAPFLPGSPSGGDSSYSLDYGVGCCIRGGGVVWIVTTGTATIDGRISATAPKANWQAASGGSVWIAAKDFSIGESATIDVSGADAGGSTPTAAGGGGRISFAKNVPEADLALMARGERPDGYLYNDSQTLMTVDVSGGTSTATDAAEAGTATYVTPSGALHFVTVAGNPVEATGVSPAYASYPLEEGSSQTYAAPEYGVDPANASWRHLCLGYVVSNATEQIDAKSVRSVSVTVGKTDMSLTWLWDETEYLAYLDQTGPGHLTLLGETHAAATNVYLRASANNLLTAVPDDGCEFLYWLGEVTEAERCSPTITLTAAKQQHVKAVFRVAGASGTYTWKDGIAGEFLASSNWEGGIVPGAGDSVVIASGVCKIPEYVRCANLSICGTGKVVTVRQQKTTGYDTSTLKVTGDVGLSDTAVLQLGASDGSSTVYNTLEVDGSVVLEGSAVLLVSAGRRTGSYTWTTGCGFVRVAGDFRLKDTSSFRPNCDGYYGGSVKTTVGGAFAVAAGAKVDADGRGMGLYRGLGWQGGLGSGGTQGSGHYGHGTSCANGVHTAAGYTYDNAFVPLNPGQQNREATTATLCRGGGVIRVFAGSMRIDGTVTANGVACDGGNSSGGTILLVSGNKLAFGAAAVLSAQGGYSSSWSWCGCGGGGCVAVYDSFSSELFDWLTSHTSKPLGPYAEGDKPPSRIRDWSTKLLEEHPSFADAPAPGSAARDISACWGSFRALTGARPGLSIIIR